MTNIIIATKHPDDLIQELSTTTLTPFANTKTVLHSLKNWEIHISEAFLDNAKLLNLIDFMLETAGRWKDDDAGAFGEYNSDGQRHITILAARDQGEDSEIHFEDLSYGAHIMLYFLGYR